MDVPAGHHFLAARPAAKKIEKLPGQDKPEILDSTSKEDLLLSEAATI